MNRVIIISAFLLVFSIYIIDAQNVTLLFAGDAMQHREQLNSANRNGKYDYSSYFQYVEDQISKADIAVVNLEATLGGKPYTGYPAFSAPDDFAKALKVAGFDVFLTANNHCLDRREKGLRRTIAALDSLDVKHTGTFCDSAVRADNYPLIIDNSGLRFAMLNYTYGTNGIRLDSNSLCIVNYIDTAQIRIDFEKAETYSPDLTIAFMHWGNEYEMTESAGQRKLAKFLVEVGADIIIGSHPHVVQPIDTIFDSQGNIHPVVYSLGNFVSAMATANTSGGMMVKITVEKNDGKVAITALEGDLIFVNRIKTDDKTDFVIVPASMGKEHISSYLRARFGEFVKNAAKTLFN